MAVASKAPKDWSTPLQASVITDPIYGWVSDVTLISEIASDACSLRIRAATGEVWGEDRVMSAGS